MREDLLEEILGDLEEKFYEDEKEKPSFRAKLNYWYQVLNYVRPFAVRKSRPNMVINYGMYRSHFKIGRRNLLRNKWYSLVNIGGLAVGMGVCLVICQYIYFELSYDKFHDSFQNIYRVIVDETRNGVDQGSGPFTTYSLVEKAMDEIPEINDYVRFYASEYNGIVTNPETNDPFTEEGNDLAFADQTFLKVFNFPLKLGNKETALNKLNSIVITEEMAHKYFGSEDPLGKTLKINGGSSTGTCTVTGVLEELPINSHLQFKFLRPLENLWQLGNGGSVNRYGGWAREWFGTYLSINEGAELHRVSKKLDQLILKHKAKWNDPEKVVEKARLQPVSEVHLKSDSYSNPDYVRNKGNFQNIRIFLAIALFILVIAWVNYINLSTARSIQRAKEVGIRKSIGAAQKQLIGQFMVESVLVNAMAGFLAIGVAFVVLPVLGSAIGIKLDFSLFKIPLFWLTFTTVVLLGSVLSGLYPAFVLSSNKPISMFSGNNRVLTGNLTLRKGLIAFQFLISLLLVAGTYLVYEQITFMKNQELGMEMEKVLVLKGPKIILKGPKVTDGTNMDQIRAYQAYSRATFKSFKAAVAQHHSIATVAGSHSLPGKVNFISVQNIRKLGAPENEGNYGRIVLAGLDFLDTYGLELIAGNPFAETMAEERAVIINEEAVQNFGFSSPQNAIGETLAGNGPAGTVVGVVKNFHWDSLRDPYAPYLFAYGESGSPYFSFKINLSNFPETLAHIKTTYDSFYPGNPFEHFFMEDDFNTQYREDIQFGNLFLAFTVLAILIACIGLFALISFSATLKIKEIGIRKVLGASTREIMMLLSKEYLILLVIAIILAAPIILYLGDYWLENYAFRTSIGLDLLIIPPLILFVISLLTVSHRTYFTAQKNPVESLRTE